MGFWRVEQASVMYDVMPPVQLSTMVTNTMISTPIMRSFGTVGVTYGPGQKVVVSTTVAVVLVALP
jgi:hypothetical protein